MEHPLDVDVGTLPRLAVPSRQQRAMAEFWRRRQEEIEATVNFSERAIPMARLRKVICAEKGSMMMTFDMPAFLSKACELFVQELAIRAWFCAESHHRCTVLGSDIAEAIASTESYRFLLDILYAKQHRSSISHHPKPTRKRPRPAADQPSTYRRYPPHHHQIPQFPTPMPTTIFHHMPLSSFPFLPREASATTPTATGQCTALALAGPVGGLLNIPNIYLNMMSMTNEYDGAAAAAAYGVGDAADTSNAAAQQGDLTVLPCPFNTPPFPYLRRYSCPLPVANSNDPAIATTVEFLPKGKGTAETNTIRASGTANSYGDNDVAAAAVGQQQQQEKETSVDDHQNESAGAETIVAAGAQGNKNNIGEDGIDESLLDKFLEEIQIDEDYSLLSPDTTSADFLSFINTIPDMEEWINDPAYLLDDVFSDPSTSSK